MTRTWEITQHHHQICPRESKQTSPLFHGFPLPSILKRCWLPKSDEFDPAEHTPLLLTPISFREKYGSCQRILHYGTYSSVRLYTRSATPPSQSLTLRDQLPVLQRYVVKVFRPSSSPSIVAGQRFEQALSSAISHPNICRTRDVLLNERGEMCQVMDYCAGGDLNMLVATSSPGSLDVCTADCFFKQIVRAVAYLHENGIAHCDLKTDNVLLTPDGAVKLADFGSAQWLGLGTTTDSNRVEGEEEDQDDEGNRICLRSWSHSLDQSLSLPGADPRSYYSPPRKVLGSIAYLPPEEFGPQQHMPDRRAGDVWAAGLIYMAMRCSRLLWRMASEEEDSGYRSYLHGRRQTEGFFPIEKLGDVRCRNVIYAMLHPDPNRRIRATDVLRSEWLYNMRLCEAGETGL